jgi:hypothetical protein
VCICMYIYIYICMHVYMGKTEAGSSVVEGDIDGVSVHIYIYISLKLISNENINRRSLTQQSSVTMMSFEMRRDHYDMRTESSTDSISLTLRSDIRLHSVISGYITLRSSPYLTKNLTRLFQIRNIFQHDDSVIAKMNVYRDEKSSDDIVRCCDIAVGVRCSLP